MDDTEQAVRLKMTEELREASSIIKARTPEGSATPAHIWKQFVRNGFLIDENIFQQWRAGRLVPLVTSGAIGEAFRNADLASPINGHFLVQPDKWRIFCHRVATKPLAPAQIIYEGPRRSDKIDEVLSDPDDLATHKWIVANSIIGKRRERDAARKARGLPPESDDEVANATPEVTPLMVESALASATKRVTRRDGSPRPGARMVWLPDPSKPEYWLPYASAPSTAYWPWKWGLTKEAIKAGIRMASRWSTDFKDGFVDISNLDATRWIYAPDSPVPPAAQAKFRSMVEHDAEADFRVAYVRAMAWRLKRPAPDFEEFDYVMNFVKGKTRDMIERGMNMDIPLSQLVHWFNLAKLEREGE